MASYQAAALEGDATGVLREAVLHASLWAIGSSWALAIREAVTASFPDTGDAVVAELLAAAVTTAFALGATFGATRCCRATARRARAEAARPTTPRR